MTGRAFSAFYARSFERHPYITLGVANGALGVLSDVLAQGFEAVNNKRHKSSSDAVALTSAGGGQQVQEANKSQSGYDPIRSARFLAFNVGMAPILAEWNKFIEHRFPLRPATASVAAGTSAGAVGAQAAVKNAAVNVGKTSLKAWAKRVAVDQIGFAPFGLVMFTGAMGIMEGRSLSGIQQKFSDMYFPALLANWQVWPLVQAINFRFMPLKYRVPFTSSMGVLWTVYLSLLNMSKSRQDEVSE